jgi:hypothetical protein
MLPSNRSIHHIAPSLRLFIWNSLQVYHHFFFSEGCDCDQSHVPSPWLGSPSDYFPTAPSLRSFVRSDFIRCKLVHVYQHHPLVSTGEVLRVVDTPTSLALKLLVVSSFVSEGADPSKMSNHSLPVS